MSYILDALKKSEEERKKGDVPGLQTYTPTAEPSSGNKAWVIGIAVLITTNIVGLAFWAPWQTTNDFVETSAQIDAQPKDQVIVRSAPAQPAQPPPRPIQPAASQRKEVVKAVVKPANKTINKPVIKPMAKAPLQPTAKLASIRRVEPATHKEYKEKAAPSAAYLPQLSELPQSIQAKIPDLTFSSHMYSSQDKFRSITINGKRLKQGRYYNENLYVNEITEKGAIMGFEGTLFEVDVLGQWGN